MDNDIDESGRAGDYVGQNYLQKSDAQPGPKNSSFKKSPLGHDNIVYFDSRRIRHLERMIDLFHVLFRR